MPKILDIILTKKFVYSLSILIAIFLNITLSIKGELNVYSFIILTLICCFEIFIFIEKSLNPKTNLKEMLAIKNSEYIKNGYEEKLNEIINNKNINSVFINGEFGSGKSTMLDYVIEENNSKKKILHIEPYDEFVEENFIDFLYELCLSKDNNAFFQRNKTIIIPTAALIIATLIMYFLNQSHQSGLSSVIMLLIIYSIAMALTKFKEYKEDKIKYIKNQIKNYDYIIVDDLDRIYIESKEILKMIHFMSKNYVLNNVKLIMLGDTLKFTENGIDVLEKYYEYKFEIPSEIIKTNFIKKLHETIPTYDYKDELSMLTPIWKQMSTRNIKKIITHLKWERNSQYRIVTEKLYNSDYLYVLTLSINNVVNVQKLFDVINYITENRFIVGDEQAHIDSDISLLKDSSLKLKKVELEYLKNCYCEYKGLSYNKNSSIRANSRIESKNRNRIFNQPIAYKQNSYKSNMRSQKEVLENFDTWLINDPEIITYSDLIIYSDTKQDTAEKILNACEHLGRCTDTFISYLNRFYSPEDPTIKSNINIYFKLKTYYDRGYDETADYSELSKLLIDNWSDVWIG